MSEEDVNTMSTLDAQKSKREKINGNQNTKCIKKVHEKYPDAKCEVVKDMSNCIKMCEQIGKWQTSFLSMINLKFIAYFMQVPRKIL